MRPALDEDSRVIKTGGEPEQPPSTAKIETQALSAGYGKKSALVEINLKIPPNHVTAIIGPSGCGKSTLLRCMNRMHELIPSATTSGSVLLDGVDIYGEVDAVSVRRKIGMVFQRPNPFPNMTIRDNVVSGLKLDGVRDKVKLDEVAKRSLESAFLWHEVKEDLHKTGSSLSGGQQQRLCIARAIAIEPEVLLMDEPCSSLDPLGTSKIEELIFSLKQKYTVVIVTHNLQQAARIADYVAFLYLGKLVEFGTTKQIFEDPSNELTERYVTGRFG